MSVQNLLILLLALVALAVVSAVAGLIGYSVSREGARRSPRLSAAAASSFFSVMTLFIALLAVLVPAVT
ncbi:hypothetical protein WB401_44845 [Streptomyces brasiliscabiei]|uniref:Secreted protein n=1 Tax=Streptomyces brasiliscabiei TaxID=2736302 RepID=A0ABU8GWS5_9ACTN